MKTRILMLKSLEMLWGMQTKMEDVRIFDERMDRHREVYDSARSNGRLSLALEFNQKMYEEYFARYQELTQNWKSIAKTDEKEYEMSERFGWCFENLEIQKRMEELVIDAEEMLSGQMKNDDDKWRNRIKDL